MLELQRNVIFGQYIETGSLIHRLDPRIKIVASVILIIAAFLVGTFLGFGILFLLAALVQVISKIPLGYIVRGSVFFLGFLAFIMVFQILFYPGEVRPDEYLWRWGILSVSTAGLESAGILTLRVVFLYYITTMLLLVTSLVDLTNGLELIFAPLQKLRVPVNEIVLVFVIAIKFVPIFIEEIERLARARTARGVPFDEGSPVKRARRIGRLLIPIFIGGFARADRMTLAMHTRCYRGGRGRTKLRRMDSNRTDWLTLLFVVVWSLVAWQLPGLVP